MKRNADLVGNGPMNIANWTTEINISQITENRWFTSTQGIASECSRSSGSAPWPQGSAWFWQKNVLTKSNQKYIVTSEMTKSWLNERAIIVIKMRPKL